MSKLRANQLTDKASTGAPTAPNGLVVTGVTTSTTFSGSGSGLTGLTDSQIPNLNASKITAGTLPTARGGTGLTSLGTAGKALKVNSAGNALEYGDAGAWTVIASGSGPGAASINIDNIFSDTYYFYKLYYSWSEDDWIKVRYIKADGSIESGSVYVQSGTYTRENGGSGPSRTGHTNYNYGFYNYWNGADNCPAISEIFYVNPYSSTKETIDFFQASQVDGTSMYHHTGSNCNMNAYAVRGVQLFGNAGDNLTSANFKYLVLGAKI